MDHRGVNNGIINPAEADAVAYIIAVTRKLQSSQVCLTNSKLQFIGMIWLVIRKWFFLTYFSMGYNACVVSICAGSVLIVVDTEDYQYYDPPVDHTEYDAICNSIPPKKKYDMDDNMEPEKEELLIESENTLTEVDYGFLLLFIGQFLIIGLFDDVCLPHNLFASTVRDRAEVITSVQYVY